MNSSKLINILQTDVLPLFGSQQNIEAIETAIDIVEKSMWHKCSDPPVGEKYVGYDDEKNILYALMIIKSDILGYQFGYYNQELKIWFNIYGVPFSFQMLPEDEWVMMPAL